MKNLIVTLMDGSTIRVHADWYPRPASVPNTGMSPDALAQGKIKDALQLSGLVDKVEEIQL